MNAIYKKVGKKKVGKKTVHLFYSCHANTALEMMGDDDDF